MSVRFWYPNPKRSAISPSVKHMWYLILEQPVEKVMGGKQMRGEK
jgi:hypothetical protein